MLVDPISVTLRRVGSSDATITAQMDPEGRRDKHRRMYLCYTTTELREALDVSPYTRGDQIIHDGDVYDVLSVEDFSDAGLLAGYEAYLEQEGTDSVTVETPTGTPTFNDVTGAKTQTTASDTVLGWVYDDAAEAVAADDNATTSSQRRVVFRVKRDYLSAPPTTGSRFVADGVAYRVTKVVLDDRTQRYLLHGIKAV